MGKRRLREADGDAGPSPAEQVEALAAKAKGSADGLNSIVDLLELCDTATHPAETVATAYDALQELFLALAAGEGALADSSGAGAAALETVAAWVHEQRLDFIRTVLATVRSPQSTALQIKGLGVVMTFVREEALRKAADTGAFHFPNGLFERLVDSMVQGGEEKEELLTAFAANYLDYDDVRHYTLKNLGRSLTLARTKQSLKRRKTGKKGKANARLALVTNAYHILHNVDMPEEGDHLTMWLADTPWEAHKIATPAVHRKSFTDCWMAFLQQELPSDILKAVLRRLEADIIPHLHDPKLLADFLTDAYDAGGVLSILSLQALFVLMLKHHLDYPRFYPRLYDLLTPDVFHVKYRARFFKLVNTFMTSTHLAAYLVAAFVKRLSRLSLTAPPGSLLLIGRFVYNLIRRHPSCKVLIHRAASGAGKLPLFDADPYDATTDLESCKALESSLWELQSVLKHYHFEVARVPRLLEIPALGKTEFDLKRALSASYASLFASSCKRAIEEVSTTYERPASLFPGVFEELWAVDGEESES